MAEFQQHVYEVMSDKAKYTAVMRINYVNVILKAD
jgi:hypothetical protein